MKFLLCEIIPRDGFNLATGRFWPAGRMFDTPGVRHCSWGVVKVFCSSQCWLCANSYSV